MTQSLSRRLAAVAPAILIALLSAFVVAKPLSSAAFHADSIAMLDRQQTTVMELTAASTAASAALSLLPGDAATPIAEKLADLSSYFLIALSAVLLEKYLLTVTGYIACVWLIPAACALFSASLFVWRRTLRTAACKLLLFAVAICLVIPAGIRLSSLIESTYQASIQQTIDDAKDATQDAQNSAQDKDLLSRITDGITGAVSGVLNRLSSLLNRFLEALAVMLVTSCLIPVLVLLLFVWLIKLLWGLAPDALPSLPRKKESAKEE